MLDSNMFKFKGIYAVGSMELLDVVGCRRIDVNNIFKISPKCLQEQEIQV